MTAVTGQYFVGVDLGQSRDFTAIAVLERAELRGDWDPVMYAWRKTTALRLRHLERVPLGTPYTEVVDRVGAGDAVLAVTALCVSQGAPAEVVGFLGNLVGAQAVATVGHRHPLDPERLAESIHLLLG